MLHWYRSTEWRLLWPFYLEASLGTMLYVFVPFMVLYFNSIGLSSTQIGFLMSAWPLASLIAEVPTGAVADLWGRKVSVITGHMLEGMCAVMLFLTTTHWLILVLFFLLGISRTLTSGAKEAWAVDLLKGEGRDDLRSNYFARYHSLFNLAFVVSGVVGAWVVARFELRAVWLVTGISYFMSGGLLLFGREEFTPQRSTFRAAVTEIWRQTRDTAGYALSHRSLFLVYAISAVFAAAGPFRSMISWTPFLRQFQFPEHGYGYLWSGMNVLGIVAPLLARRMLRRVRDRQALIWLSVITLVYGLVILITGSLIMLIGMILFSAFLFDFRMPINRTFFHRFVPSAIRGTSGSFEEMLNSAVRMLAFPIVGLLLDLEPVGPRVTVFISTLFMVPVIFLYRMIRDEDGGE